MSNSINVNQATLEQAVALAGLPPGTNIQAATPGSPGFPKPVQLPTAQAPGNNATLQLVAQLLQIVTSVLTLIKDVLSPGSQKPAPAKPFPQSGFAGDSVSGGPAVQGMLPRPSFTLPSQISPSPSFSTPIQLTPPRTEFEESIRDFAAILSAIDQTAPLFPDAVESVADAGVETWDLFFGSDEEDIPSLQ